MDFLSGFGAGGGGGKTAEAKSTAQTIFGGYNSNQQLSTAVPWVVGGAAITILAIAFVLIAAMRR